MTFNIKSTAEYISYRKLVEQALESAITSAHEIVAVDAMEKSKAALGRGVNGSKLPPREGGLAPRRRVPKGEFGLHFQTYKWTDTGLKAGPKVHTKANDLPYQIESGGFVKAATYLDLRLRHRDGTMRAKIKPQLKRITPKGEWDKRNSKTLRRVGYRHSPNKARKVAPYMQLVSDSYKAPARPFFGPHAQKAILKHDRILRGQLAKRFKDNQIPYRVGFAIVRGKGYKL